MSALNLSPALPSAFDSADARRTVSFIVLLTLEVSLARIVLTFALGDYGTPHLLSLLATPTVSLIALGALRSGRVRLAATILLWGMWTIVMTSALFTSGTRTIGLVAIPLLIILEGWLFKPRQAMIMAAMSVAGLLGISLSEINGWVYMAPPLPPLLRWVVLSTILAITAYITALSYRVYMGRFQEKQRLAATLALVTERSPIMLAAVDAEGNFIFANQNYARFHGRDAGALVGTPAADTVGTETMLQLRRLLVEGNGHGVHRFRRHDHQTGTERWVEICVQQATNLADGSYDGYYAILRDVTDEIRTADQIRHLAYHDVLTGLPNRALLTDRLRLAVVRAAREDSLVAVCYLDLDGFKLINDTWGHSTGDIVLSRLASRLAECVRATDTVARLGGDEFVVLIGDIHDRNEIPVTIDRLLKAIATPISVDNHAELRVSASIGVAICPVDGEDPDLLLRRADQAMLTAKQSGRNRITLFDTELEKRTQNLQQIVADVAHGLDRGEFQLYYQPKVNMRLGTVVGFEALLRWRHPTDGLRLPGSFLPHIEALPVANRLGQWVLTEAMAQMSQWAAQGMHLPVSVNISGDHLAEAGFTEKLADLFDLHPTIPPERLEIEILETTAMDDVENVARIMRTIATLGARFALDDFGTGYASLTYFRRLPAQTLKVDRSFVRDILDDPEDLAIVKGVTALASSFGRSVIAEGLETIEHGRPLLAIGCDFAQGYGIAHPMPAEAVLGWLARWQAPAIWHDEPPQALRAALALPA